jgi:3-phosphoshikimate 1-carboxyvinyltransferase
MSEKKQIFPVRHGLQGEVNIPGDKSVSHRSVILSALADTPVRITNFLQAQDCLSTVSCMKQLGAEIDIQADGMLLVTGNGLHGLQEPAGILDAGDSGTLLRLLLGLLAPQPFLATFTGDASLSRRPMGRVIEPLTQMGAHIVGRDGNRLLPITVLPALQPLTGITYQMPVASAQVKSALLLAGMYAKGETTILEPYTSRDHTERMLEAFGVPVRKSGGGVMMQPAEKLCAPEVIDVPGDISSAAYWMVAASVIDGSDVLLKKVGVNPTRTGILDVLRAMGADIQCMNERVSGGEPMADIRVRSAKLHGVSFGAEIMPRLIDEIPILAVAAMFASGETTITGAGELRVKETDRLQAIIDQYTKLAPCIEGQADGLVIHGSAVFSEASCFSYDDHRIAMSLAIAGAAGQGVTIENAACVNISYPEFYTTLHSLMK